VRHESGGVLFQEDKGVYLQHVEHVISQMCPNKTKIMWEIPAPDEQHTCCNCRGKHMNKKKENKTCKEDWKLTKTDCMREMDIHFNPRLQMDAR